MTLLKTFFLASVLCASPAWACEPVIWTVADYAGGAVADHAVFLGTVKSVQEQKFAWGVTQRITMDVTTWFSGAGKASTITVAGSRGSPPGSPCAGLSDFSGKVGEQWLIFGQQMHHVVSPDDHLSRRAPGGRVDPKVLAALGVRSK